MRVVATAGHVDHGKSSLVLALTGTDPDRFPEEKARGLTIDLGFAFTALPSGTVVGFVDVPGHVRFVKNMLAGVGAVDVAVLVVAANEGWMPQSEEHLRILELLDVAHGAVVVSKADLVDADTVELARLEIDEHLAGTPLARWPVVVADSVSGRGIDDVARTLDAVLAAAAPPVDRGRPRLWVDRVFAARGAGTVVTGTLAGGTLAVDDEVVVEPGGRRARVRAIESHHERVARAGPGNRVALNLAGVDHREVRRGDAVVVPGQWAAAAAVDVAVRAVPGVPLPRRAMLQAHAGSGEQPARWRFLDAGGRYGRLRFEAPLPLAPGDRLVLRSSGRRATVGGAEVLDVDPARRTADARARLALPTPGERVLAARPWLAPADLVPLAGADPNGVEAVAAALVDAGAAARCGPWLVATGELERVRARAADVADAHHRAHPLEPGTDLAALASSLDLAPARLRAALAGAAGLVVERDAVRLASHTARVAEDPESRRLLDALEADPFAPPSPAEVGVGAAAARALAREGLAVDLDGVLFATGALDRARDTVGRAVVERGSLTVAEIRDLLGSTRKYVLPIVHRLDAEGVTRRQGDARVPGPRAPRG